MSDRRTDSMSGARVPGGDVPHLVLVHGWGLHSAVWETVATALGQSWRVSCVDLPGHGVSAAVPGPYDLESLAGWLEAALPKGAIVVGWSLGGLVAMRAACALGRRLAGLVMVASTPRFVAGEDWPHGVSPAVLAGFAAELQGDFRATLVRFLALQTRGSDHAREDLRRLRAVLFARGEPTQAALVAGLTILAQADLRAQLSSLRLPTLWLMGARDTLVPPAAGWAAAAAQPAAGVEVIPGAGHAPFLSHPQAFVAALQRWLNVPPAGDSGP